jgi:hypothetical protein
MGKGRMVITLRSDYDTTRAAALKARLAKIKGVSFVDFDYINNKVALEFDPDRVSPRELEVVVTQENKHRVHSVGKPASGVKCASIGNETPRGDGEFVFSEGVRQAYRYQDTDEIDRESRWRNKRGTKELGIRTS